METPAWLAEEILDGITRLYLLRLKGGPAANLVQKMAEEWEASLMRNLSQPIREIDAPRIREGFDRMIDKVESWPAPATLHKMMPPRPARASLPAPPINEEGMERGRAFLKEISAKIGGW